MIVGLGWLVGQPTCVCRSLPSRDPLHPGYTYTKGKARNNPYLEGGGEAVGGEVDGGEDVLRAQRHERPEHVHQHVRLLLFYVFWGGWMDG